MVMHRKIRRSEAKEQDDILAFLAKPESHGVKTPVTRLDTHISHIFLVGDRALKLKRAVKLDFLDFSTPEMRRRACLAELRLNRRTAPDMYLELQSVHRASDGSIGFHEGVPVDWLVVMRRFDDDALLEQVAERGEITRPLLSQLADKIAHFHSQLPPVFGKDSQASLRDIIEGNHKCMEAYENEIFARPDVEELLIKSELLLEKLVPLLDHRDQTGHIRHCHGDLHLANICIWNDVPTLFDCLEFNEQLATIDVLYDIAFLLMDLWHRGLHSEANMLFNRYLDMSGEGAGIAAMPLFLSMRAAIRAHVTALQSESETAADRKARLVEKANAYLLSAVKLLRTSPPRLIAIGGLSGTGKSTLARAIAAKLGLPIGARLLSTDVLRKRMFDVLPEEQLDEQAYGPEQGNQVYAILMAEITNALASSWTVIADGVFAKPEERQKIAALAEDRNISFTGFWLQAPINQLKARVDKRVGDASDADHSVVEKQTRYDIGDLGNWNVIDSSLHPDDVANTILSMLSDP